MGHKVSKVQQVLSTASTIGSHMMSLFDEAGVFLTNDENKQVITNDDLYNFGVIGGIMSNLSKLVDPQDLTADVEIRRSAILWTMLVGCQNCVSMMRALIKSKDKEGVFGNYCSFTIGLVKQIIKVIVIHDKTNHFAVGIPDLKTKIEYEFDSDEINNQLNGEDYNWGKWSRDESTTNMMKRTFPPSSYVYTIFFGKPKTSEPAFPIDPSIVIKMNRIDGDNSYFLFFVVDTDGDFYSFLNPKESNRDFSFDVDKMKFRAWGHLFNAPDISGKKVTYVSMWNSEQLTGLLIEIDFIKDFNNEKLRYHKKSKL